MDGLGSSERDRSRDEGRAWGLWERLEGLEVYNAKGHASWQCGKPRGVALDQGRGYFDGECLDSGFEEVLNSKGISGLADGGTWGVGFSSLYTTFDQEAASCRAH